MLFLAKVIKMLELFKSFMHINDINSQFLDLHKRNSFALSNIGLTRATISQRIYKESGFKFKLSANHNFTVCVSHDIDTLFLSKRHCFKQLSFDVFNLRIPKIAQNVKTIVNKRNSIFNNIEQLTSILDRYNISSTFFFMALEKYERDFNYEIDEVKDVLLTLVEKGHAIGLHGGHEAYFNKTKMLSEKNKLEDVLSKEVIGYRNHYLKCQIPDFYNNLEYCGFKYDSTIGYHDMVGFRNGVCFPFQPYNEVLNNEFQFYEIPLALMDVTLYKYLNLDFKTSLEIAKYVVDGVASIGGVFTLLWHNTEIFGERLELFLEILNYCQEKHAIFINMEQLIKMWEEGDYASQYNKMIKECIKDE